MSVDPTLFALTALATLGCGLVAGLFLPFSTFTMVALTRLPSAQGMAAMQAINVAVAHGCKVINRWFGIVFIGTSVVCLLEVVAALAMWDAPGALYRLVGGLLYLAGTVLVTVSFNVPLNEALAAAAPDRASGAELWARYTVRWTAWNHVRAVAALGAATLFIISFRY